MPAGRFDGCVRARSDAQWGPWKTTADSWRHPAVPALRPGPQPGDRPPLHDGAGRLRLERRRRRLLDLGPVRTGGGRGAEAMTVDARRRSRYRSAHEACGGRGLGGGWFARLAAGRMQWFELEQGRWWRRRPGDRRWPGDWRRRPGTGGGGGPGPAAADGPGLASIVAPAGGGVAAGLAAVVAAGPAVVPGRPAMTMSRNIAPEPRPASPGP